VSFVILGADPGVSNPALALVERLGVGWRFIASPVLHSDDEAIAWICDQPLQSMGLRCIAVEDIRWSFAAEGHGRGSGDLPELVGALRLLARQLRIPIVRVRPQTWRSAVGGSAKATKQQVREWVRRQVSGLPATLGLNRSDAIAIAIAGARMPGARR
jgi:Holliday junction resolvasome RuvABC endonuclease subunit